MFALACIGIVPLAGSRKIHQREGALLISPAYSVLAISVSFF